ncbi:MAG: DUF1275 domain-containing protein [Tissierellia bacterium]|nr:DUF1275 domain-containing protein [Tissierellia bacterium]
MKFKVEIKHVVYFWLLLLTFNAGYMNVAALIGVDIAIGNHTGNLSNLAIYMASGDIASIREIIIAVSSYLIGATVAGFIFYEKKAGESRRFGVILIIYGIIYLLGIRFIEGAINKLFLFSLIAGSQNGILTRYRGLTTRTTHMTGYLTDVGVSLGKTLRGDSKCFWQFLFYFVNIVAFIAGGVIATLFPLFLNMFWKLFPGIMLIFAGTIYIYLIYDIEDHEKILS